ncbi:M56 family metallopeptidase [Acidianus brierleyi]|uniref:Heat-shock protein HspX n=1 Tax=Acidianus brierleyi TaxID=41673 RepID=A0A2U9ICP3_9CREN|nr:M56 family metallopeptidase [Acidianus brierleyi]AWR93760.1 M48 family metalloprotease [Acidianus brierleyi]
MVAVFRYWIKYYVVSFLSILIIDIIISSLPINFPLFFIFQIVLIFGLWYLISPFIMKLVFKMKPADEHSYLLVKNLASIFKVKTPKVYIADVDFPNAFAFGNIFWRGIAITKPIFNILDDQEISAVIGHELSHLKNKDPEILILSIMGINSIYVGLLYVLPSLTGAIIIFYFLVLFPLFFAIHRRVEKRADITAVKTDNSLTIPLETSLIKLGYIKGENLRNMPRFQVLLMKYSLTNSKDGNAIFRTHPSIPERLQYLSKYEIYNWTVPNWY